MGTPIYKGGNSLVDANGNTVFTLSENPGLGQVWTASVQAVNAPPGANFIVSVDGTDWGHWTGAVQFGPVQLANQSHIQIQGSGLTPGTIINFSINGINDDEEEAETISPSAQTSTVNQVESVVLLYNKPATTSFDVNVPSNCRRLSVLISNAGNTILSVTGKTSGIQYYNFVNAAQSFPKQVWCALEPLVDPVVTIALNSTAGTVWVVGSITNPLVVFGGQQVPVQVIGGASALPANAVPVTNPTTQATGDPQPLYVDNDRPGLKAVYYGQRNFAIAAAAPAFPLGNFFLWNPLASTRNMELRQLHVSYSSDAATAGPYAHTLCLLERFTFSGGTQVGITPVAQRASADPAPQGAYNTTIAGLTGAATAGSLLAFLTPNVFTAVGSYGMGSIHKFDIDERVILLPGEGILFHQTGAGVASDPRNVSVDVIWGEYN